MMTQQEKLMSDVTQHIVFGKPQQNGLSEKALSPAYNGSLEQAQEYENQHLGINNSFTLYNENHHEAMTHKLKGLLESGDFEKALSLAREVCHDPELGKDPVFLETALVLMTNMEKTDCMWKEVKTLNSMDQLYPAAKTLTQYYMPAALLTAEMILCKEWCDKSVCVDDLQQITSLWVSCLWAQSSQDKDAFEAKIFQLAKHILREPTFVLKLVKAVHAEVGSLSLVVCVNLCLLVIQIPPDDPQNNPINASRIDANNTALCSQLAELLTEDQSLQRLCLLTAFTITPTKELFAEVDTLYKMSVVRNPMVPLLPSCLSCVLVQCMESLLPESICHELEWRYLRGKCVKYLETSSVLNLQVKLPNQEVNLKMYIKEVDNSETNAEMRHEESSAEAKLDEDLSEEMEMNSLDALHTKAELQWLASMMSLDMSWEPPWLEDCEDDFTEMPMLRDGKISSSTNSPVSGLATQAFSPIPCSVVLKDLMLNQPRPSKSSSNDDIDSCPSTEETLASQVSFKDDHAYSLPPPWLSEEEIPRDCPQDSRSTEIYPKMDLDLPAFSNTDNPTEGLVLECESADELNLAGLPETNETNHLVEWIDLTEDDPEITQENPIQKDNVTLDKGLDNLENELSYVEGRSTQLPSEHQGKLAAGISFHRSNPNYLQDIHDFDPEGALGRSLCDSIGVTDVDQSELSYDAQRWFESADQPSETSSIVAAEVMPDPITEQTMQWTAIKSINEDESQTFNDTSWSKLDLWLSDDPNVGPITQPDLPSSVPDNTRSFSTIHWIHNPQNGLNSEKRSLENTINRLRASLNTVDKNQNSLESQNCEQQNSTLEPHSQQTLKQKPVRESANSPQLDRKLPGYQLEPNRANPNQRSSNCKFVDQTVIEPQHMETNHVTKDPQSQTLATSNQQSFNQCPPIVNLERVNNLHSTNQRSTDNEPITQLSGHCLLNQLPRNLLPSERINKGARQTNLSSQIQDASSSNNFKMTRSHNQKPHSSVRTCHGDMRKVTDQITHETTDQRVRVLPLDFLSHSSSSTFISTRSQALNEFPKTQENHRGEISFEKHSTVAHTSETKPSKSPETVVECRLQTEMPKPAQNGASGPCRFEPKMEGLMLLVSAATEEYAKRTRSALHAKEKQNAETQRSEESTTSKENETQNANQFHPGKSMDNDIGSSFGNQNREVHERLITPVATAPRVENSRPVNSRCPKEAQVVFLNEKTGLLEICDHREVPDSKFLDSSCATETFQHKCGSCVNGAVSQRQNISTKKRDSELGSELGEFEVVQDVTCTSSASGKITTPDVHSMPLRRKEFSYQDEEMNRFSKTRGRTIVSSDKRKDSPEIGEMLNSLEKNDIKNGSPTHEKKDALQKSPEEFSGKRKVEMPPPKDVDCKKVLDAKTDLVPTENIQLPSSPPTRRYSLRGSSHAVNYFVPGSGTDAEISSESPSEDDRRTRNSYSLRSSSLHRGKVAAVKTRKMPRRTSRATSKAARGKPKKSEILPSGKRKKRKSFGVKRRRRQSGKPSSTCKAPGIPQKIKNCDQNNNQLVKNNCCDANGLGINKMSHPSPLTKSVSSQLTIPVPQLPWETRPPLRTYSSKKRPAFSF